jgi:carbamate kinase
MGLRNSERSEGYPPRTPWASQRVGLDPTRSSGIVPTMRAIVVLGGNAFASGSGKLTMAGQFEFARQTLGFLGPLLAPDVELVLGHGNGPQVGHMLIRVEQSLGTAYAIPLEVCVAESEGELGYVLEQSLYNVLADRDITRPVVSVLTQIVVDAADPGFQNPTKPIGPFYDAARAEELRREGLAVKEDAGRGFRRVVASPEPLEVVEADVIEKLVHLGAVVIAAGGGGIPVVREGKRIRGVDAVIDKDFAAALLGERLAADLLVIVTGVAAACVDWGKPTQRELRHVSPEEVRRWAALGHFAPGSMGPKMEAAARFASVPGRRAIICEPSAIEAALRGEAGTTVALGGSTVGPG